MCGIAGAIEREVRSAEALEDTAWKMIAPLVHRGPDAGGVWTDAEAGVAIGHRRLSIIDLSPAGAQPMVSASGRYLLSYNGEIYNTAELRADLERQGATFRGHSDTEVLLEACAAWGVERAVKRLIGMFAFALWDRAERCLWLVRDRIGIKPLHYSATPQRFAFASELTGLKAHPGFDKAIDRDAVEAFLALDYIPAPHSIFRDAKKLEPGTILRVDAAAPAQVEINPYWTLAEAAQKGAADRFAGTFEEAADELERLLADAVKRRMVSDVPLGAFLSGGIDSSTVVALMQKQSSRPVKTFIIGFASGTFDEAPWAKAIAEHLGTDHTEHYVTEAEIRAHGPAIMGHHDEPLSEPSVLQTWILCRMARRDVTVVLSGDGGDELFGGYPRHIRAERLLNHPALHYNAFAKALIHRAIPAMPRFLRKAALRLSGMSGTDSLALSHREAIILAGGIHDPGLMHHCLAAGDIGVSSGKAVGPALPIGLVNAWLEQVETLSPSERQQYIDTAGRLPDYLLSRYDRMSMGVSLELRVPILDHRIIEFAYRLLPAMKAGGSTTKRILRNVLVRHVPPPLFEREKRGFGAPMRLWMQGPLREWAGDLLCRDSVLRHDVLDPVVAGSARRQLRGEKFRRREFRIVALAAWCDAHL